MNKLWHPILLISVFCVFCASFWPVTYANEQTNNLPKSLRHVELHFPKNVVVGTVIIQTPEGSGAVQVLKRCSAKGDIAVDVPPGYLIALELGGTIFANPDLIRSFWNEPIERITLSFSAMDDDEAKRAMKAISMTSHFRKLREINLDRSDADDEAFTSFHNLPELRYVSVFGCGVRGDCLPTLATCPKIDELKIWNCPLKAHAVSVLPMFKNLAKLNASSSGLNDEDLLTISKCTKIDKLRIYRNRITDEGIKHLQTLKKLTFLDIDDTNVTLKGVRELKGLKLTMLKLPKTVAPSGDAELHKLFPQCQIVREGKKEVSAEDMVLFGTVNRTSASKK